MLEQYKGINQAAGVTITINPDGSLAIDACLISVIGDQLDFVKKLPNLPDMKALMKALPAKSFVALNLSGKGILQKQVQRSTDDGPVDIQKVIPSLNPKDFYVQQMASGSQGFISMIRRTEADSWIEALQKEGFIPLILSLGPFPVMHVERQLNVYDYELIFNGHRIYRTDASQWESCTYDAALLAPFPLKLESEGINERLLMPYAAAFQLVMAAKLTPVIAEVPVLETTFHEVLDKKKLQLRGGLIVAIFFILLLINFILFSWLNSDNNKLSEQVGMSAQSSIDLEKIDDQVKQKEALLHNLGWDDDVNKSALVDQLADLLPPELNWQQLDINPVDLANSRIQKLPVFFERQIRVIGTSGRIIPVNEWIARIKTRHWVKSVQLESYDFNNELNIGQFMVIINY